jgi:hypothetical protein|eukprot:jgi/Chrpa1/11980/Chrysochromulina_OHIO_Genome00003774-RA
MMRIGFLFCVASSAAMSFQPRTTSSRRDTLLAGAAAFLTTGSAAFAEETLSPAQQKIAAAKAASEAKLAGRGLKTPETKTLSIGIPLGGGSSTQDYFAEANELKEKRQELEEKIGNRKKTKSQSAQIETLRLMEKKARGQAQEALNRQAEIAAAKEAEKNAPPGLEKIIGLRLPF